VRESGVRAFTMRDIDERGLRAVMEEAIRIAPMAPPGSTFARHGFRRSQGRARRGHAGARRRHLSRGAFGNGNDLRFRRKMVSMEVVEVNPVIDEANRTADLAVELIMSGLGKRIL
jgi:arginase